MGRRSRGCCKANGENQPTMLARPNRFAFAVALLFVGLVLFPPGTSAVAPPVKELARDFGPLQALDLSAGLDKSGAFVLAGQDAMQQLLVTGHYAGGHVR